MKIQTQQLSDEQLAADLRNGDLHAMEELYVRYFKMVYFKCFSIFKSKDDASDFAQDIMLKAFDRISTFRLESKFSSWLYSIASNYCIDSCRKGKTRMRYAQLTSEQLQEEAELPNDPHELFQSMDEALSAIDVSDRILLEQKYLMNMSIRELEVTYQLSSGAIKMRLKRARERITVKVNTSLAY